MKKTARVIGVDESGKGDFFGPLVIGALLADSAGEQQLKELGVKDGKLLSERRLSEIDAGLRARFPHTIIVITPEEYNRQYKKIRNLNKLLAEGHAEAIDRLMKKYPAERVVSDKFGKPELIENALICKGREISLEQIVRGESVLQVAAASIIARARFISEMEKLAARYGCEIPRGASDMVDRAGRMIVAKHGPEVLSRIAKIHFKNYQRVISPSLF